MGLLGDRPLPLGHEPVLCRARTPTLVASGPQSRDLQPPLSRKELSPVCLLPTSTGSQLWNFHYATSAVLQSAEDLPLISTTGWTPHALFCSASMARGLMQPTP